MATQSQNERRPYPRTGCVNWVRFTPCLFVVFSACVLLAWGLDWCYRAECYAVGISAAIAGVSIGCLTYAAVAQGHCRNRTVAAFMGILAGLVLYLGHFQAGIVNEIGIKYLGRLDLLPYYIKFRMNSDVMEDPNHKQVTARRQSVTNGIAREPADEDKPEPARSPWSGKTIENWIFFFLELGIVLVCTSGFAIARARRAFCDRCHKWMEQQMAVFLPGTGAELAAAFQAGRASAIAQARVVPILQNQPYAAVAVDYCQAAVEHRSNCPAYLSIKETKISNPFGKGQLGKFDTARGKLLIDRDEISAADAAALAPRFTFLSSLVDTSTATIQPPIGASASPVVPTTASVEVQPVFPGYAGKILTRTNIILGNLLVFVVLVGLLGGIAVMLAGIFLVLPDESPAHLSRSPVRIVAGIVLIATGIASAILSAVFGLRNSGALGNRRLLALTRRAFRSRPERWMDYNDPEAVFVEIVPRKNWSQLMLETAEDIGFLLVDNTRRELLFEGDRECYRIPAGAIISCDVEEFSRQIGNSGTTWQYFIVIRAWKDSKHWECCLARRWTGWTINDEKRWLGAQELQQCIRQILAPGNGV